MKAATARPCSAVLRSVVSFVRLCRRPGVLLVGLLLAISSHAQTGGFMTSHDVQSLGDGLYTFRYGPYRNIFLIGSDGVIVTDPIKVPAAKALRAEIAKLTDLPVKYVAYSHSHWDHAVGGAIFKDEGAVFAAQERCRDNIHETPHPDLVEPDIVYSQTMTLEAGDQSLELHYFGPNHGDCLSVMVARPANVAFIVDLVNPPSGWHLEWNPTAPDTHFWNLRASLAAIEEFLQQSGVTTFVGGHLSLIEGPTGRPTMAPAAGSVSAVAERRIFWDTIISAVDEEMAKGTVGELVASKLDRSPFESRIDDYDHDEMSILLRRIASYVYTGF